MITRWLRGWGTPLRRDKAEHGWSSLCRMSLVSETHSMKQMSDQMLLSLCVHSRRYFPIWRSHPTPASSLSSGKTRWLPCIMWILIVMVSHQALLLLLPHSCMFWNCVPLPLAPLSLVDIEQFPEQSRMADLVNMALKLKLKMFCHSK